jgi:hypothetical protein
MTKKLKRYERSFDEESLLSQEVWNCCMKGRGKRKISRNGFGDR